MKRTLAIGLAAVFFVVGRGLEVDAVQQRQSTPQVTATSPTLEQRDQPVTNDDLRILLKTDELLKDESVWNRKDDRECDDDEATGKRSLFCALQKACIDVLGAYDFNNLPATRLADIKRVLRVATDRVKSRLKNQ
jgi:hypothetical protein